MSNRAYVYVDGESHFLRARAAWRQLHASDDLGLHTVRYRRAGCELVVDAPARLFWASTFFPGAIRTHYFTTFVGNPSARYAMSCQMRNFGLEPNIFEENRSQRNNRDGLLQSEMLIEKPKQVDCALCVQLMLDAFRDHFDECHVFTSDVDYLPAFRAVRSFGKIVYVHGFGNGVTEQSPLRTDVDRFFDMTAVLRDEFELLQ